MYKIFLSFIATFSLFFGGCSQKDTPPPEVLVSIPPYLYFVEALTGGQLKTISLAPAGSNPPLYEPTPKQVQEAQKVRLWIRLNESFEKKVEKSLLENNNQLTIVNLAESSEIPYIYEDNKTSCHCHECDATDRKDLHIWFSLKLAKIQANIIARALIQTFPQHQKLVEKNLLILQKTLEEKDLLFTQRLDSYKNDSILVSHPAFSYFCRDYEINQVSIESEGKDPRPQKLAETLALAKAITIRTVLTQSQYNNKGAEIIAKKLGLPLHEIDPYSPDYLGNLELMTQYIVAP
jgi:zinc transport system substrate-binding protein